MAQAAIGLAGGSTGSRSANSKNARVMTAIGVRPKIVVAATMLRWNGSANAATAAAAIISAANAIALSDTQREDQPQQPQQRQYANETRAPAGRAHVGQQDANDGRQLPGPPAAQRGSEEVFDLPFNIARLAEAAHQQHAVQVGAGIPHRDPLPARETPEVRPPCALKIRKRRFTHSAVAPIAHTGL